MTTKNKTCSRILTLMLAFVMVFTGMGIGSWGVDTAWADDDSCYTIKEVIGITGEDVTEAGGSVPTDTIFPQGEGEKIGTYNEKDVYYIAVDAQYTSVKITNASVTYYDTNFNRKTFNRYNQCYAGNQENVNSCKNKEVIKGNDFHTAASAGYSAAFDNIAFNQAWVGQIQKEEKLLLFTLGKGSGKNSTAVAYLIVKVAEPKPVVTEPLDKALAHGIVSAQDYYSADDRYNGKTTIKDLVDKLVADETISKDSKTVYKIATRIDRWTKKVTFETTSFWQMYQAALERVNEIYPLNEDGTTRSLTGGTTQKEVDAAAALFNSAAESIIPQGKVNPTALYEAVHAKYSWPDTDKLNTTWYEGAFEEYNIKADTVTTITWEPYAAALADGQDFLDSLYDADGKPTEANNEAAIKTCEDKVSAIDTTLHALAPKEAYEELYQAFTKRMDEAEKLLTQYAPTAMDAKSDAEGTYPADCAYTKVSWDAYVAAYRTLKSAAAYQIKTSASYPKGGTREDYDGIKGFAKKIEDFRDKVNALVSDKDITVSVSYVNNTAARHPQIRFSGTDIYENEKLPLKNGSTTIGGIIEAAKITFDNEPRSYQYKISEENVSTKDSRGISLMVFVNGDCRGIYRYDTKKNGADIPVQLHDGDQVAITRIPPGFYATEASSGYDTTEKTYSLSFSLETLGDSVGQISIDSISQNIKVGDTVSLKACAKGTDVTNQCKTLSAENLTLFVSGKAEEQNDTLTVTDFEKTNAVTDENGKTEYVFREAGWYTVALFDLNEETAEFTDVYGVTEKGNYPGAKVGGYATVYVAPAANETAQLAKWRKTNLAEAKALYETYNDAGILKKYGNYSFDSEAKCEAFKAAYETLKANQEAETESFKNLMDAYDRDLAEMNVLIAEARDHESLISRVKTPLSYLPETAEEVTYAYKELLQQLQTNYQALNAYEAGYLLTPAEKEKAERLLAVKADELSEPHKAQITVSLVEPKLLLDGQNQYFSTSPWSDEVFRTDPTGTETRTGYNYGVRAVDPSTGHYIRFTMEQQTTAYAGDRIVIDRLMQQSDDIYWAMYSIDGGASWTLAENAGSDRATGVLMRAEFTMPETKVSTLTVQLKGISKAEYEALAAEIEKLTEEERTEIKAAIQAAYDSYDLTKYDEAGKAALKTALDDGLAALAKAVTKQDAADARKAALAAMAAVAQAKQGGDSPTVTTPSYPSGKTVGRVYITIENSKCLTTETSSDKGHGTVFNTKDEGLYGAFIEGWYDLGENDTMMTCILKALEMNGYGWEGTGGEGKGYSITYISGIFKDKNGNGKWDAADEKILSEFDGGQKSGWMGTQNDWFNNESFAMFSVANGKLENGDELHLMYTADYGEDLGGSWNNGNTELESLMADGGTLSPAFSAAQKEYTLLIGSGTKSVKLTPTAANKNYQVRIFLNDYNKESARYKRTESISVKAGDILYVGVGESGWATMNSSSKGTKYTIKVLSSGDADSVKAMLAALKTITYNNYKAEKTAVETARAAYNAMDAAGKAKVTADELKKLTDAETEIKFYSEIDDAKDKLGALTDSSSSSQAKAALSAYEKLNEKQRQYITEDEVKKFNELAKKYNLSTITGSAEMPESEVATEGKAGSAITNSPTDVKVSGTTGVVTVKEANQKEILKQAKEKKSSQILLVVADSDAKGAEKFEMNLDKSFLESLLKDTSAKLVVKTPLGQKTYERDELQKLVNETTGATVKAEINKDNVDTQTEEPADDNAAKIEKAKSIVKDMKLTARSSKTAKKNIKAVLKSDAKVNASIKKLKDLGFTVKYRFYRSTKKAASYKSTVTKKTASYTNTSGRKGTKYFYKVQVRVYD